MGLRRAARSYATGLLLYQAQGRSGLERALDDTDGGEPSLCPPLPWAPI